MFSGKSLEVQWLGLSWLLWVGPASIPDQASRIAQDSAPPPPKKEKKIKQKF